MSLDGIVFSIPQHAIVLCIQSRCFYASQVDPFPIKSSGLSVHNQSEFPTRDKIYRFDPLLVSMSI